MNHKALFSIFSRIQKAAAQFEKKRGESKQVQLLAVTKRQNLEAIKRLVQEWQSVPGAKVLLAENYTQELLKRRQELANSPDIEWHLIGPLQSNKVRLAVQQADVIETIHSQKIALLVNNEAITLGKIQRVFVQVNISQDSHKSGVSAQDAAALLATILKDCPALCLEGLMTITEHYENPEFARQDYAAMSRLRDELSSRFGLYLGLSMGMSEDFELAIEEGADIVRIGTALFGEPRL